MMAPHRSHDSNGGRFPSDETLDRLRTALIRYLEDDAKDETEVCAALEVLAKEAHDRKLRAEDMLVAFKTLWNALPQVTAHADRVEQRKILDHLVRFCIDAFYQS
ncbi:MAG: hypothetical protein M3373_11875 [Gemmatimonadota bacterium]|nr:hypothetical protein [Gemmatimonadota bacterium]